MNRRNFFKNLGAATVGVIVAPAVVVRAVQKAPKVNYKVFCFDGYTFYFKIPTPFNSPSQSAFSDEMTGKLYKMPKPEIDVATLL